MAILGSFLSIILSLAVSVLVIASWWILYGKMGELGWKVLVPFYGQYTLYKRVWSPMAYFLRLGLSIIFFFSYIYSWISIFAYIAAEYTSVTLPPVWSFVLSMVLMFVSWVAVLVISFVRDYKIAKCFGYGVGYCLGIAFLPVIFVPMLAFGSSRYENLRSEDL